MPWACRPGCSIAPGPTPSALPILGAAWARHAERIEALEGKVAALTAAQNVGRVGTAFPPAFLLIAVMSLATAWSAASPFGPSVNPRAAERPAALREGLIEAVR